jgi:hypothetical protein
LPRTLIEPRRTTLENKLKQKNDVAFYKLGTVTTDETFRPWTFDFDIKVQGYLVQDFVFFRPKAI